MGLSQVWGEALIAGRRPRLLSRIYDLQLAELGYPELARTGFDACTARTRRPMSRSGQRQTLPHGCVTSAPSKMG